MAKTHVSDVDRLASLRTSCGKVGERVGRDGGGSAGIETAATTNCANWTTCTDRAAESTSSSKAAAKAATASSESATATEAAAKTATATSEATTAAKAHVGVGEAVGTNLEGATLPVVTIELLDGVASIVGSFEDNDTGALGPSIGTEVHVGANDTTSASWSFVHNVNTYNNLENVGSLILPACLNKSFRSCHPTV